MFRLAGSVRCRGAVRSIGIAARPVFGAGVVGGVVVAWGVHQRAWCTVRCDYNAERERVVREFYVATAEGKHWDLLTVLQLVWKAILESPFLSLGTILSGVLSALVPLLIPRACRKFLDVAKDSDKGISELIQPTIELLVIGVTSALATTLDYCLLTELVSRIHMKLSTQLFSSFLRQDMVRTLPSAHVLR